MSLLTQQESIARSSLQLSKIYALSTGIIMFQLLSIGITDVGSLIQDLASIVGARPKTHVSKPL